MSDNIKEVYTAVIEDIIQNVTKEFIESRSKKEKLDKIKELWLRKTLNHPALKRQPKLNPVLLIDDMEKVPIKITVPRRYKKTVPIHQTVIMVPRFIIRQQLLGHVLYVEDISNVIDLSRDLAEIILQLLVDNRCEIIKKEVVRADEEVKAKNAAMKRNAECEDNGNTENLNHKSAIKAKKKKVLEK